VIKKLIFLKINFYSPLSVSVNISVHLEWLIVDQDRKSVAAFILLECPCEHGRILEAVLHQNKLELSEGKL
jgi:hypothetical protein